MAEVEHWYLHVDLDAFFASVEQLDHPEYRGKPLIVGGKPEDRRSVVSTASYEARKYGVHSAMPTFQAYKLCPNGIFVRVRMERYSEMSYKIMNIFRDYSPDVKQISIDEAFIDLTGTEKLFGPPEKTAIDIKTRVKNETGLTVSVGLATTKYLAKIASGFSKPDGFYHIKRGDEKAFILNLPLNKVWGLGKKSIELIHSKGMRTTRDIYEKDYTILEFLFGKNMATFLYNVVRGTETSSFDRETKNHSISSETTFPYDLTDVYLIETELLELSQSVFFRLMKHESYSRTAFVKIRYDDFSTCSIQETSDRNIMTLDSYFEIVKRLFEKKYQIGRGIRLLGVGFENVVEDSKPEQQELFPNNDEKKHKVEQAILNLSKKHPEIKIRKARTFKCFFLCFLIGISGGLKNNLQSEDFKAEKKVQENGAGATLPDTFYTPQTFKEPPDSLFNWEIDDKNNVDFLVHGHWKGAFLYSIDSSFGAGTNFVIAPSSAVFRQDVELYTWAMLNNRWYFESDFADEFTKNTIAMGYIGSGLVKSFRVSNRGITMPSGYSSEMFGYSLKGGNNQSPGISLNIGGTENSWKADFLIRYDMTSTKSATFYGMNSVSDTKLSPADFLYGNEFYFPKESEQAVFDILDVYVENKSGTYSDNYGKKYKKLSSGEYAVLAKKQRLFISERAGGGKSKGKIPQILLTFKNDANVSKIISDSGSYSDNSSFLGKIQKAFDSSGKNYRLDDFSCTQSCQIEGKTALVIQSSKGFCPYIFSSYYDCGLKSEGDIFVISSKNEKTLNNFSASVGDESYTSIFEDLFNEKHMYAKIINEESLESHPFVRYAPEIYLNLAESSDIKIVVRKYQPVKNIQIATSAVPNSVSVYINGTLVAGCSFNQETGVVELPVSVSATDKIYITWQEDSSDFSRGALATGLGFKTFFTPSVLFDASFTVRWPISINTKYSLQNDMHKGFAAFSSGISFEKKGIAGELKISEKSSVSVNQENTTKGLIVNAQKQNVPQKYYPKGYNSSQSLSFSLKNSGEESFLDIKLQNGELLKNSSEVEIEITPKIEFGTAVGKLKVFLIVGVDAADESFTVSEKLPKWELSRLGLNLTENKPQTLKITLSDKERSLLTGVYDARLIVKTDDDFDSTIDKADGTISFVSYKPIVQNIFTEHDENINVRAISRLSELQIKKTIEKNCSTQINWNMPSSVNKEDLSQTKIKTISYFEQQDFSSYKTVEFNFALEEASPALTFILDNYSDDFEDNSEYALKVELKSTKNLIKKDGALTYHTLQVNLDDSDVFVDGTKLTKDEFSLKINRDKVPSRQIILIDTFSDGNLIKNGSFYIDNLLYTNSKVYFLGQNYASLEYKKNGTFVKTGDFEIFKDAYFDVNSYQTAGTLKHKEFQLNSNVKCGITVTGIKISADASFNKAELSNAGYYIKSENERFRFMKAEESFRYLKKESFYSKNDEVSFDFSKLSILIPLKIDFKSIAEDNSITKKQNTEGIISLDLKNDSLGINFLSKLNVNQKIKNDKIFDSFFKLSGLQFSAGENTANHRVVDFSTTISGDFPFARFKPVLEYGLNGTYNFAKEAAIKDNSKIYLKLPFLFDSQSFEFSILRNADGKTEVNPGGSYIFDGNCVLKKQIERKALYDSIPFYELFDLSLKDRVFADYSTKYQFLYKRKIFNSYADIFVPSSALLSVIRDIKNISSSSSTYQFKIVLSNTSVNNFGLDSINKTFKWFKQDELFSSITGIIKIPEDKIENTTYQITVYSQLFLMITDKSNLLSSFDAAFETDGNFSSHATLVYKRPSKSNIISAIAALFTTQEQQKNFKITRNETMNLEAKTVSSRFSGKLSYLHSTDLSFLEYFTVSIGIGGSYNYIQGKAHRIGLDFSIGAKAEF